MSSFVPETGFAQGASVVGPVYDTSPAGLGLSPSYLASASASSSSSTTTTGTAFPTSPADGNIFIYTADAANGVKWAFVYDSSQTTYKWVCIGGSYLTSFVATEEGTASSTFGDFTTSNSITLPAIAGDWEYVVAAALESSVNNVNCFVAPKFGAAATASADGIQLGAWVAGSTANGPRISLSTSQVKTGLAASTVVKLQIANSDNASGVVAKNRSLMIRPRRGI